MVRKGNLIYDSESGRMDIRFGMEEYYGGLHCGECRMYWLTTNGFPPGSRWLMTGTW